MKTKGFITISVSAMLLTVMLLIGTAAPVKAEETETDPTSGDCGENVDAGKRCADHQRNRSYV